MSKHSQPELKIVLIGKTGSGKTSIMNAILERPGVKPDFSAASETTKCRTERREFDGQKLAVVDTPGLCNTKLESNEVKKEILSSILSASPGPCVFLYVVKPHSITEEDKTAMKTFWEIFGEGFKKYCCLVYNAYRCDETGIKHFREKVKQEMTPIEFGGGFFDFTASNKNPNQVHDLLKKINSMVAESKEDQFDDKMQEMQKKLKEVVNKMNTEKDTLEKAVKVILDATVGEPFGTLLLLVNEMVSQGVFKIFCK